MPVLEFYGGMFGFVIFIVGILAFRGNVEHPFNKDSTFGWILVLIGIAIMATAIICFANLPQ